MLFAGAASQEDACAPDCTGVAVGEPLGSLCDCREYYVCLSDGISSDSSFICPPEAPYFEPDISTCGNDASVCPTPDPGTCLMECSNPPTLELIVEPNDCTKYYVCDGISLEPIGPVTCPNETSWFNGTACVSDQLACCARPVAPCDPFCTAADVNNEIIDPLDCTKYYICLAEGRPSELHHLSCSTGQNFDTTTGHCSQDAPCIIFCSTTEGARMTTPA